MTKFLTPYNALTGFEPWYVNFITEYELEDDHNPADFAAALAEWNGTKESGIGFHWFVFENDADAAWFILRFT